MLPCFWLLKGHLFYHVIFPPAFGLSGGLLLSDFLVWHNRNSFLHILGFGFPGCLFYFMTHGFGFMSSFLYILFLFGLYFFVFSGIHERAGGVRQSSMRRFIY